MTTKVLELFGVSTASTTGVSWPTTVAEQHCPYLDRKCFKTRKSEPEISIGTCVVRYGRDNKRIIICPSRLLEQRQIFTDEILSNVVDRV